jgi:hypothetical protein
MVIPSADFAGPRSEISHFDLRRALKAFISFGDKAAAKMSSTWMEKMTVPEGEDLK